MILLGGRLQCEVGPRGLSILWCQIVNLIPTMQFTKESAGSYFKEDDLLRNDRRDTLESISLLRRDMLLCSEREKTLEFPI